MRIHKEGYKILTGLFLLLVIANGLMLYFMNSRQGFLLLFLIFSLVTYLLVLWFFRVPSRTFNEDENHVISPADGRIVAIEEIEEDEYFNERRLQVSIFMSPLNVHVNHFPITGLVKYCKYHPGNYLVAWHPKASTNNERSTVVIENGSKKISILVRQIAGVLARRIICYARSGESVRQGGELGFIKFGSRVDLLLPVDVDLKIRLGQKVNGKTSVIASFR
jgi:phosphatidylserine decarboxylase